MSINESGIWKMRLDLTDSDQVFPGSHHVQPCYSCIATVQPWGTGKDRIYRTNAPEAYYFSSPFLSPLLSLAHDASSHTTSLVLVTLLTSSTMLSNGPVKPRTN